MPLKTFWTLNRMIERVRADEILATMPALSTAMGGEHVEDVVADYQGRVGNPTIVEQLTMGVKDKQTLKALFGRGSAAQQ